MWKIKTKGNSIEDIHNVCSKVTDAVMKLSLKRFTSDNITCVFICFENFRKLLKEESFERNNSNQSEVITMQGEIDLSGFDVNQVKGIVLNPNKKIKLLNVIDSNNN